MQTYLRLIWMSLGATLPAVPFLAKAFDESSLPGILVSILLIIAGQAAFYFLYPIYAHLRGRS